MSVPLSLSKILSPSGLAIFHKLTCTPYLTYSTQFIRLAIPSNLDIQNGLWDVFGCCLFKYGNNGLGWLSCEAFWLKVWECLVDFRRQFGPVTPYPFGYQYLPHVVHFYAKSRDLALLYPRPRNLQDFDTPLHLRIDSWNRKTYFQTYWDPQPRFKWGLIVDDKYIREALSPRHHTEAIHGFQRDGTITSDPSISDNPGTPGNSSPPRNFSTSSSEANSIMTTWTW
ncbi:uncharacterized protein F4822DRAFT_432600 [Hypoxylon trugodes]|uniref:uncharacterized protein n=1 Tax=Hypoxylon trugodes TaxID=326681 RepID=UPI00218D6017|nr:uncharacterized protein F4822DRAFT_432600 [Hypoxylon trugodes]KAI1385747.1 hypothetical protein F4822DRAFT_432600 [Hypoxylon trugodes]